MSLKTRLIFIGFIVFTVIFFIILIQLEKDQKRRFSRLKNKNSKRNANNRDQKPNSERESSYKMQKPDFTFTKNENISKSEENSTKETVRPYHFNNISNAVPFVIPTNFVMKTKKRVKFQQSKGNKNTVVCPKGYHYKPNKFSFTQATCEQNMKFCTKYDDKLGSCLICEEFFNKVKDLNNNTMYCEIGTMWTLLSYGLVVLILILHCLC